MQHMQTSLFLVVHGGDGIMLYSVTDGLRTTHANCNSLRYIYSMIIITNLYSS